MQWLQNPNQSNADIVNNVRFVWDISYFKKGYETINSIVKYMQGDLVTDSHRILEGGGTISLNYSMYMGLMV
jgi:hypothetical protein